jgi:hypothetical protein
VRRAALAPLLLLAACDDGGETARDAAYVKAARAGMNAVRGIPGGMTANFTEVRLVGDRVVCGKVDGNDGDGPRAFRAEGTQVQVEDKRDPATLAAIAKGCEGRPVREIVSRNAQFTDLEVGK